MTKDDIREWALRHGFVHAQNDLECTYMGATVRIEFLKRNVRVVIEYPAKARILLASAAPGSCYAFIDEDDMLQGFGLSGSFLQRMVNYPDAECPPWFSGTYRNLWEELRQKEAAPAPRP